MLIDSWCCAGQAHFAEAAAALLWLALYGLYLHTLVMIMIHVWENWDMVKESVFLSFEDDGFEDFTSYRVIYTWSTMLELLLTWSFFRMARRHTQVDLKRTVTDDELATCLLMPWVTLVKDNDWNRSKLKV